MLSVRLATVEDTPDMARLLKWDSQRRTAVDPRLWAPLAPTSSRHIGSISAALASTGGSPTELWLVAREGVRLVGLAHASIVPVPPIYEIESGPPGLLHDDGCVSPDAPDGTAQALLAATEAALRNLGAGGLIASCLTGVPQYDIYLSHGYAPVTLYLGKSGLTSSAAPSANTRRAAAEDLPRIITLSAAHRRTLQMLNGRFWHSHPEADARFGTWMRYSLTLADRDMIVAGAPGRVQGYIIAQPIARFLIPIAHDISGVGVIDDFYAEAFSEVCGQDLSGGEAAELLCAAESALAGRGFRSILAVCPAGWESKLALLQHSGYRAAKVWMLKG